MRRLSRRPASRGVPRIRPVSAPPEKRVNEPFNTEKFKQKFRNLEVYLSAYNIDWDFSQTRWGGGGVQAVLAVTLA